MQDVAVETRSFRLVCARLWLGAGVAHLLLLAPCVLATNLAGLLVDPLWLVVMFILPSFYWIVYGLKYRLTTSTSGLGWVNSSGVDCFLPWLDIEQADHNKTLGFPVLRVWSKAEGGLFLVPLFLKNSDILPDALRESAGETHPVTLAVSKPEQSDGV